MSTTVFITKSIPPPPSSIPPSIPSTTTANSSWNPTSPIVWLTYLWSWLPQMKWTVETKHTNPIIDWSTNRTVNINVYHMCGDCAHEVLQKHAEIFEKLPENAAVSHYIATLNADPPQPASSAQRIQPLQATTTTTTIGNQPRFPTYPVSHSLPHHHRRMRSNFVSTHHQPMTNIPPPASDLHNHQWFSDTDT